MQVMTAMLARHAEVRDDQLHIEGGGYGYTTMPDLPGSIRTHVALTLAAEPGEVSELYEVRLIVGYPDGTMANEAVSLVLTSLEEPLLRGGQMRMINLAAAIEFDVHQEGRHHLAVFGDGSDESIAAIPFGVVLAEAESA